MFILRLSYLGGFMKFLLILILLIFILFGCGQKGDLVLPDSVSDDVSVDDEREAE
jgi:predicted small lipoprotein YifL